MVVGNRDGAAGLILLPFLIWVFPAVAGKSRKQQIQAALRLPGKKK